MNNSCVMTSLSVLLLHLRICFSVFGYGTEWHGPLNWDDTDWHGHPEDYQGRDD